MIPTVSSDNTTVINFEEKYSISLPNEVGDFYNTRKEIKADGLHVHALHQIKSVKDIRNSIQYCFAVNTATGEKWYLKLSKLNPNEYFIFIVLKKASGVPCQKLVQVNFQNFITLLEEGDRASILKIFEDSNTIVKYPSVPFADYLFYFFVKQFFFSLIFIVTGIPALLISMGVVATMYIGPESYQPRGFADIPGAAVGNALSGIAYIGTLFFLSLPLVGLLAGYISAAVSGKWAGQLFDVSDKDNVYKTSVRRRRWYKPYFYTMVAFIILFISLILMDIHNDSIYGLISAIVLPVILLISDKLIFYDYFTE